VVNSTYTQVGVVKRRDLLKWGLGAGVLPILASVRKASANTPVEDLIHILEDTPRDQLLRLLIAQKERGLTDFDLFTAICLAGVKQIEPYPSVGFKYHAVMMMSSVHLTRLQFADKKQQWLPLLWSADQFKSAQAQDLSGGDWQMQAVKNLPASPSAALIQAMEHWDVLNADLAITAWSRSAKNDRGRADIFELLFYYGARDLRDIGHKTIAVSNCYRVLNLIGWQHRETMLRSTVYALLNHGRSPNPALSDLDADRPGRVNMELIKKLPQGWREGRMSHQVTLELYRALGKEGPEQIGLIALNLIEDGVHPQVIWDAVFMASAQLIMERSTIVPVHATTTVNALNFAYRNVRQPDTRMFLLLQALSFTTFLRRQSRGRKRDIQFDKFEPVALQDRNPEQEIFYSVSQDRSVAAGKMLRYLQSGGSVQLIMQVARTHIVEKNFGYHDYKFVESAFENYTQISPRWRDRYLSASTFYLNGSEDKPNKVVAALKEMLV